jgi:hypothetical protein
MSTAIVSAQVAKIIAKGTLEVNDVSAMDRLGATSRGERKALRELAEAIQSGAVKGSSEAVEYFENKLGHWQSFTQGKKFREAYVGTLGAPYAVLSLAGKDAGYPARRAFEVAGYAASALFFPVTAVVGIYVGVANALEEPDQAF